MANLGSSAYRIVCPHCQSKATIRSSLKKHDLLKVLYLQCSNPQCSWSGRASLEITHQLSASAVPNPDIQLPKAS
jgi:hypothetical protein